jgi:hypothetical protein
MKLRYPVFEHRISVRYFPVVLFLVLFFPFASHLSAAPSSPAELSASLSKTELPARGRQESILTITKFGRYAVTVKSDQGTGLQLVDHMAGPGQIAGVAGESDGRLDLFLEKGQYKIVTFGHERASGSARLEAHPFTEKEAPRPSALIELKLNEAALKDFEQRSYWLEIKERKKVALEAAGRSLADLRLWVNGKWLLDVAPAISTVQAKTGQPLKVCRLVADLEPGLYLLSAYGGAPLPWAEDSGLSPFYLRYGIPELGSVTRKRFVVSPFGTDRFLVPGNSTYFRLELPEARDANLQVGWFDAANPFNNTGSMQVISKKSLPPVAELMVAPQSNAKHIVSITGEAGSAYVYQHFESAYAYSFKGTGDYWISSVHSGHPQDSLDATAVVTSGYDARRTRPMLNQTIELDQKTGYSRKANLLGALTLFLKINSAGSYQVLASGVDAQFLIEPFFTNRPVNYATPHTRPSGSAWDLDAGYYILTVEPEKKGIMDLLIRPQDKTAPGGKGVFSVPNGSVQAAVRFPRVSLDRDTWYTMYLNSQPEVKAGLVLRPLPLDLRDPLPITQMPNETVSVPIQVAEEGTLRAETESGALMDISLDNGSWQKTCAVSAGRHSVSIRSTSKDTINYALQIEPKKFETNTPLPALSDAALASLPDYPVLTENTPRFFDLERNSSSAFLLRAEKSNLYRIQTTGLLSTSGGLRSRTNPALVQESENGFGRNFFLQQYLREGDYLIGVASNGDSKGHLGLSMSHTELIDGGYLTSRIPARMTLPAGKAAAYHFIITRPGEYRLRAFGLGRTVKCRLEDEDGWPVETPNIAADITRTLEKGRYRIIILPESTDARIVSIIDPILPPRSYEGHGPHHLPLSAAVDHRWLEPASGQKRRPDQWNFEMPASGDVAIELTGEMQAELVKVNQDKTVSRIGIIPPMRGWNGSLLAGAYRMDVLSTRVNNQAPYRLSVRPAPLMDGMSRDINVPSTVPISVGHDGLVEISSFGSIDVKARLMTEDGTPVAENDDRPDDWNFQIATSLKAGAYRLLVEPVGAERGSCKISVRVPKEEVKKALALPTNKKIKLSGSVRVFPLTLPSKGELLTLSASAPENVGMAVEVDDNGWKSIGSSSGRSARLEIPLRNPGAQSLIGRYRLRLWSLDRRDTEAELSANLISPRVYTEGDLKRGIEISAAAVIKIERKGLLQTLDSDRHLRWSAGALHPCEEISDNYLAVSGGYLWVAEEMGRKQSAGFSARAERVALGQGEGRAIQIRMRDNEKVTCDLASPSGGPVLFIASSRTGRPGIELVEQGKEDSPNIDSMAIGEHAALGVSFNAKNPVARLWAASPSHEPFETRLTQISYSAAEKIAGRDNAAEGLTGAIEGVKAHVFDLSKGHKRIKLSLGEGLAAAFVKEDRIVSTHWNEGNPFTETFESDAERLLLLHTRSVEDRFALEIIPLSSALSTPALEIGKPYEKIMLNSGRLRLDIAPGKAPQDSARNLHIRVSGKDPVFIDRGGAVTTGKNVSVAGKGGTLMIEHGPGAVLVWLDKPGEEAADLWATSEMSDGGLITLPASMSLEGKQRAYRINANKPVMLHVRSATPLTAYLDRGNKAPEVETYSSGVVLDAYLPKGVAELRLRGFSGENMTGRVDIASTAVIPTGEGLGPEVLLPPGGVRLFSFDVARESSIGAGVKADSDNIDMEILNSSGRVMGKGTAQMLHVKPGTYLLKLQAPDAKAPVKARPAIVGLNIPDVAPPADEIRKYLFPEQEAPLTYTSTRGGQSRRNRHAAASPVIERHNEEAGSEESASDAAEAVTQSESGESEQE